MKRWIYRLHFYDEEFKTFCCYRAYEETLPQEVLSQIKPEEFWEPEPDDFPEDEPFYINIWQNRGHGPVVELVNPFFVAPDIFFLIDFLFDGYFQLPMASDAAEAFNEILFDIAQGRMVKVVEEMAIPLPIYKKFFGVIYELHPLKVRRLDYDGQIYFLRDGREISLGL